MVLATPPPLRLLAEYHPCGKRSLPPPCFPTTKPPPSHPSHAHFQLQLVSPPPIHPLPSTPCPFTATCLPFHTSAFPLAFASPSTHPRGLPHQPPRHHLTAHSHPLLPTNALPPRSLALTLPTPFDAPHVADLSTQPHCFPTTLRSSHAPSPPPPCKPYISFFVGSQ